MEFKSGKSSDKETLGAHIAQLKGYFNKITKCNKNIWERFKNGFEVYKFLVYTNETMKSKLRHRPNFIKITDEFKDILPLLSAAPQSKEAAQALLEFDIKLDNTTIEAMKELLQNQCLNKMYTDEKSIDICSNIIEKSAPNTLNLVFIKGNPGTGKTGTGLVLIEKYLKSNPLYATGNGNLASIFKALLKTQKHEGVPDSIISGIHSLYEVSDFCKKCRGYNAIENKIQSDILILDEAQRMWNPVQIALKNMSNANFILGNKASEAYFVLRGVCRDLSSNKVKNIIFLLGKGQEIYKGEEDGQKWIKEALVHVMKNFNKMNYLPQINVYAPDEQLKDEYVGLKQIYKNYSVCFKDELYLKNNKRDFNNDKVLDFVNNMLDNEPTKDDMSDSFAVIESFDEIKSFVKQNPGFSFGTLVASFDTSYKKPTIAGQEMLETQDLKGFFIDKKGSELKTFATEFKAQGLELDYSLFIWGKGLLWRNGAWQSKKDIRSIENYIEDCKKLNVFLDKDKIMDTFVKNVYRVLLTRSKVFTFLYIEDEYTRKHVMELINASNSSDNL